MKTNMKQTMAHILILIFILISLRCDTIEPPAKGSLSLTVEEVSCTEAWLTLKVTDIPLPTSVILKQNDITRTIITLATPDTLLYIDSLLPKHSYIYQISGIGNSVSSNAITATTLDTTSHNFTWQTFTFGEHSSNALYDVTIINENNIWAVGEIYMNDSVGKYNAVYWNGSVWELKRLEYKGGFWTIRTIFAFNENDIWFSGYMRYLNGQFIELPIPNILVGWQINKLWGSASNDLYAVGDGGNIARWDGVKWSKIESGTTVNLTDVYGTPNGKEVWACGWNNSDGHTVLMKIADNHSEMIYDSFNPNKNLPYNGFISSLWTNGKQYFWLTGSSKGIVKHSYLSKNFAKLENFGIQYFPYRIRGIDLNDISTSGDAAIIWHYNGYSWRMYDELLNLDDRVRSMDAKGEITVAVGLRYESVLAKGLLIIGRK